MSLSKICNRPSQLHCLNSDGSRDLSLLRYKPDFVTSLFVINELYCMHIFRRIFISKFWWQESDIWSQASYRYAILWEAFLAPMYAHFSSHFFSKYWWQKSDISSQASYRYPILWEVFFDLSDSYFLFADLVGFYTHLTYMHIFRRIFLSNYWWQKSDIWSQASYRYPISWEAFFDPSDTSCLPKRGGIISEH